MRISYLEYFLRFTAVTMMNVKYFLIAMLSILCVKTVVMKTEGGENEKDCGSVTINCTCGIGESRKILAIKLKMYSVKDQVTRKTKCSGYSDPYQACANHSCSLSSNATHSDGKPGSSGKKFDPFIQSFYPQEFTIPRGAKGHRYTRQSDPCHVTPLKNAEIKCWKWPNWINCDINCIHGYALQGSKDSLSNTNINCRLTENQWKSHGFQDCQPYVNCKAHLVKPGDLRCKEPIDSPAYCEISCLDYDQYEATSKQKYECVDDTFARTLPHCAVLNDKVKLVRKPN